MKDWHWERGKEKVRQKRQRESNKLQTIKCQKILEFFLMNQKIKIHVEIPEKWKFDSNSTKLPD